MKVICAGMPKSGTKSLCSALRVLGYNVYDFEEQIWFLRKPLKKAMDLGSSSDEFRQMFKGVDAVTDFPACMLWEELHRAFPDAKVILTTRRNEDEWAKSALHQIKVIRSNFLLRLLLMLSYTGILVQDYGNSGTRFGLSQKPSWPWLRSPVNEQAAKMRYREHNSHVIAAVPKDQLLHLNLRDGWAPLCEFLGHPVPDVEFPHRNKGGTIMDELIEESVFMKQIKKECLISICVLTVLFSYLFYYFFIV